MKAISSRVRALLFGCILAAPMLGCLPAREITATATDKWHLAKSPRFEVLTNGDPARARSLAEDLERFRKVMLLMTTAEEREAAPPLKVFLSRDRRSYISLGGSSEYAGVLKPSFRGNFGIVDLDSARKGWGISGRYLLFNMYVHYILSISGSRAPSWYNEGFAMYMATTEFRDDRTYVVGLAPGWIKAFRFRDFLPMEKLMASDNIASLASGPWYHPYVQAWYAVHFLIHERADQLTKYLRLWANDTPNEEAVQQSFGMTMSTFDAAIRKYAMRRTLVTITVKRKKPFSIPNVELQELSEARAHFMLGELLVGTVGPTADTLRVLERAERLAPSDARVQAALARAYWLKANDVKERVAPDSGRLEQARRHLDLALKRGSGDPEVRVVEGHIRSSIARLSRDDKELMRRELESARNAYRKAIRADKTLAEAYYGLGNTYLLDDNGSKEPLVVLEDAGYLLPLSSQVRICLAKLLIKRERYMEAIPPLEHALFWTKSPELRAKVEGLLSDLKAKVAEQINTPPAEAAE